jgi:hypothetical protein
VSRHRLCKDILEDQTPSDHDLSLQRLILEAAEIKTIIPSPMRTRLSYRQEDARIITGDPDFKKLEHLVQVEWLS